MRPPTTVQPFAKGYHGIVQRTNLQAAAAQADQAQPASTVQQNGDASASNKLTRDTSWTPQHRIDSVHVHKKKDTSKAAATIARMSMLDRTAMMKSISAAVENEEPPLENYHVERKIRALLSDWAFTMEFWASTVAPEVELTQEMMWRKEYVLQFAPMFLHIRLKIAEGRGGGMVKAITLFGWGTFLVKCIIRYCTDANGVSSGDHVLLVKGLYEKIWSTVHNLVKEYDLDRTQNNKVYYGRWEVNIMLAALLRTSEYGARSGRLVKLQTSCLIIICFYMMARPGSLAPASEEHIRRKLYLRLGDIKVHLVDGIWNAKISITIRSWKGQIDSIITTPREYILEAVTKAHNVVLDPTVWIIVYMMARGCFGPQYQTLEDLENNKHAVLEVPADRQDEPFFLAITQGGHDLVRGKHASAHNLSHAIQSTSILAGLPPASIYALRRDGGNDYANKVGVVFARQGMGHTNPGQEGDSAGAQTNTFHRYYSLSTAEIPWVGIRTGELQGKTDEVTKHQLKLRDHLRAAVDAMVNVTNATSTIPVQKPEAVARDPDSIFGSRANLSGEGMDKVVTDPKIVASRQLVDDAWSGFLESFPAIAQTYQHKGTNTTQNISRVKNRFKRHFKSPKETARREQVLRDAIKKDAKVRATVSRQVRSKETQAKGNAVTEANRPLNTSANRQAAMARLEKASDTMLVETVSRHQFNLAPSDQPQHPSVQLSTAALPPPAQTSVSSSIPVSFSEDQNLVLIEEVASMANQAIRLRDQSLAAPQQDDADPDAWAEWQARLLEEREYSQARNSTAEEDYALLKEPEVSDQLLAVDRSYRKGKKMKIVPPNMQLSSLMTSVGVPRQNHVETGEEDVIEINSPEPGADNTPPSNDDKDEVDILGLPPYKLRALFARVLVAPLDRNRKIDEYYKAHGNRWICPLCHDFTHSGAATHAWRDRSRLEYHMRYHTPWHDLEVQMATPDQNVWRCPSCSKTASSLQAIRSHCVTKCPNKAHYLQMQSDHADNTPPRTVERRRDEKERKITRTQGTLYPGWIVDDDDKLALLFRNVILDVRNWNIHQMVENAILAGELSEENRASKTAALDILSDVSQWAWASDDFYPVPVKFK